MAWSQEFSLDARTNLNECIDRHDCHIGLRFCIVHQIQVNQFFQLQIIRLHTVNDIGKQSRHILADCHARNHLTFPPQQHIHKKNQRNEKKKNMKCQWTTSLYQSIFFLLYIFQLTFLTASFFFSFLSLFNSDFNSKISPFLVVVKYFESVILFSILLCANVSML